MTLYMKVTRDKYELPVAVAESKSELARMLGVTPSAITHGMHGLKKTYLEVEVDEHDE